MLKAAVGAFQLLARLIRGGHEFAHIIVGLLFELSDLFLCRILLGPVQVYAMLVDDRTPLPVKAGGVGIQLISFYWFYLIVKMARKTLAGTKAPSKRR